MTEAVLALDLGSTQLKLMLMDRDGKALATVTAGYPTQTPAPGWLEQRPEDWAKALKDGMAQLRAEQPGIHIAAIGLSGHMSGTVLLDEKDQVLCPCIMLSDSRSEEECRWLQEQAGEMIRSHTGNAVINAFTLPKLKWLQCHEADVWRRTRVWLSPKDYIRLLLTGQAATEYTDAFNSLCVDAQTAAWSDDIIAAAGLEREKFPPMLTPRSIAGTVTQEAAQCFSLTKGIPVVAGGADMACGALGMGLFQEGEAALTLGTCATFLANVTRIREEGFGQVTFHLHALPGMLYALGSHFNGGLAVNWLAQVLSPEGALDYGEIARLSALAEAVPPGSGGMMTLPFLAGSGSPYFRSADRQTVLGMSTAAGRGEIFRSELEGITYNLDETKRLFDRMIPNGLKRVLLGGGGTKIGVWPSMIADVFDCPLHVVRNADASTVGAGILGGWGVGFYTDAQQTARKGLTGSRLLRPDPARAAAYAQWKEKYLAAYSMLTSWY